MILAGSNLRGDVDAVAQVRLARDVLKQSGDTGRQVDPLTAALALIKPTHQAAHDLAHGKRRRQRKRRRAVDVVGGVGIGKLVVA